MSGKGKGRNKRKNDRDDNSPPRKIVKKEKVEPPEDLDTSSFHFEVEKQAQNVPLTNAGDACNFNIIPQMLQDYVLLAEIENIDPGISRSIVQLFDDDNTIPFIARYRRDKTGGMAADRLRALKEAYDQVKQLRAKSATALTSLQKQGEVDPALEQRIKCAKTLEELDLLVAPFKKESKGSLAARAKQVGLEQAGRDMLDGNFNLDVRSLINKDVPGRDSLKNVWTGLQHILADVVSKDTAVLDYLQTLKKSERISLECSMRKADVPNVDKSKYELYANFNQDLSSVRPHQVLAINRAENLKVLTVKVGIPGSFWDRVKHFCRRHYLNKGAQYPDRTQLLEDAMADCFQRLLSPMMTRQVRRTLTEEAERSSIGVFATNLKNLMLTAPYRGKVVMAIDPGVKHGCKVAIVSPNGQVLHVDKIFITDQYRSEKAAETMERLLRTYQCETVAIGNGTYCRQTEEFMSRLIDSGKLRPLDLSYTIIDEQGVSIYSCSAAAAAEFPDMDPNLISAVSLARRLQDPLAEFVKVEPKHLGVGMYQHDVPEKKLSTSLEEVVSECVSFVGVDVNMASLDLLRRVAGLTKSRAEAIATWRLQNGPFQNRQQLKKVKGIGSKSYQQCAGFIRVLPATSRIESKDEVPTAAGPSKKRKPAKAVDTSANPFDMTEIHPEDYDLADKLITEIGIAKQQIGQSKFVDEVKKFVRITSVEKTAEKYDVSSDKCSQILDALSKEADHDLRSLSQGPLFRRGVTSIDSLKPGEVLSGVVRNVTHFGAFVDIGVGPSGLLHSSSLPRNRDHWVKLGDTVVVSVINVDIKQKRIGLRLVRRN